MKIMINLLALNGSDSQSLYALNIVPEIVKLNSEQTFVVFCSSHMYKIFSPLVSSNTSFVFFNIPKSWFVRIIYINIVLLFFFFSRKFSLVYNPTTLFPFILARYSIVTIHDIAYFLFRKEESLITSVWMRFSYWFSRFSRGIVAISSSVKQDTVKFYGISEEKIIVAHNALPLYSDFDTISLEKNKILEEKYVVYVGMYRYRKNVEKIIEAMKFLPELKLVCIGSVCAHKEYLLSFATTLGVEKSIVFLGIVSNNEKDYIIKNAESLVFPSLYEGFGFPIIEAQNLGTPVICSRIPVFEEVGENSVIFVDPHDSKDIAEGIRKIFENPILKEEIVRRGFHNIKRFSWQDTAYRVSKFFI